jgi:hypothetical protein
MGRWLFPLLPLLLAGCSWTGDAFYSPRDSQIAVAAGDYLTSDNHGAPGRGDRIRITILPNGMTSFALADGGRDESLVGFVPLGPDRHYFIMWVAKLDGEEAPAGETPYGLLEALPAGRYRLYLPDCNQDRPVAVAAGAVPTAGSQPDCRFPDRAHLEAGFAAYARGTNESMELIPVVAPAS